MKHHGLLLTAIALVLLPMLGLIICHWNDAHHTVIGVGDPDIWLRLTLVRDWLSGGSWYDHAMLHSNAPWGGISSPWTRPLDVVIALVTEIQPASVELSTRLVRAALIMPLFWSLLLVVGLIRAMRALCPVPNAPLMAVLLLATAFPMWIYFGVANADHHGLLAALFINAIAALLHPTPSRRSVILSGICFALQLWINPEASVLIAGMYVWYGLCWLAGEKSKTLPLLATTIAIASAAAVVIERPVSAWFVPVYDSISVVYVFLLTLSALFAWLLHINQPTRFRTRAFLVTIGSTTILAALAYTYPLMLQGPMAEMDPYILTHFLPAIREATSPITNPPWLIASFLIQPLVLIGLCLFAFTRPSIYTPRNLLQFMFLFFLTSLLFFTQQRFYYYWYPIIVLFMAPFIGALFSPHDPSVDGRWPANWLAKKATAHQAAIRIPITILLLIAPITLALLSDNKPPSPTKILSDACHSTMREWAQKGALANVKKGEPLTILAPTIMGGEILFWTPHHIIASNYHREGAGIRYVWEAQDITDSATLRRYLAKRKVDALLLCPSEGTPPDSLLQRLQQGATPPSWLVRARMPKIEKPVKGAEPVLLLLRRESHL